MASRIERWHRLLAYIYVTPIGASSLERVSETENCLSIMCGSDGEYTWSWDGGCDNLGIPYPPDEPVVQDIEALVFNA